MSDRSSPPNTQHYINPRPGVYLPPGVGSFSPNRAFMYPSQVFPLSSANLPVSQANSRGMSTHIPSPESQRTISRSPARSLSTPGTPQSAQGYMAMSPTPPMAPPVTAYPRVRPVMRPPPSPSVPPQEANFGLFRRQLPNPVEPRIPRVLVPETQPSQAASSGGGDPRPISRILVPETQPHCPASEIDLTFSSQPIYVPSSQPSQASLTIDQAASRQSKNGKGKQPATKSKKSAKAKGKEPERDPTPEGDTHPGKKRRIEELTKDDISSASIETIDQPSTTNTRASTDRAKWSAEDILKHVTHWFSDENFTYAKNNQAAMYRRESEDLFEGRFTPQQIKDLHTRLLFKYQVTNQVLSKTGGGDGAGESENEGAAKVDGDSKGSKRYGRVKKRLLALGLKIGPASIIEFSKSNIYEKMDEQLCHCPETVKLIDMNPAREMTPTDDEDDGAESDVIIISDSDDIEVIPGPAPPRKMAKTKVKSGKHSSRAESEDSTLEILANTVKGMGDSHKSQNKMLQGQLNVAREQLAINRAHASISAPDPHASAVRTASLTNFPLPPHLFVVEDLEDLASSEANEGATIAW